MRTAGGGARQAPPPPPPSSGRSTNPLHISRPAGGGAATVAIAVDGDSGWDDGTAPAARNLNPIVVAAARDRRREILNVRGEGRGGGLPVRVSGTAHPFLPDALPPGPPPPACLVFVCCLLGDIASGNLGARADCRGRLSSNQRTRGEPAGALDAALSGGAACRGRRSCVAGGGRPLAVADAGRRGGGGR